MIIIRPTPIEFADITSSNLAESAAEYSSAVSGVYSIGDLVKVTGTGGGAATATHRVYKCLMGATEEITNCQTSGALVVGDTAITVTDGGGVEDILKGDWITIGNYDYQSARDQNSVGTIFIEEPGLLEDVAGATAVGAFQAEDYDPTLYPEVWEDVGAVNNLKPFDSIPADRATRASSMSVSFTPDGIITAVAIINFKAEVLGIKLVSTGAGTLYDTTSSGTGTEDITISTTVGSWYADYFTATEEKPNHVLILPSNSYTDITVTIELSSSSGDVEVGQIVVGRYADIGTVKHGSVFTQQDYSKIEITDGRYVIEPGSAVENMQFRVFNNAEFWPECKKVLRELRNIPVVFVPDGDKGESTGYSHMGESIMMGFIREWRINTISGGEVSIDVDCLGLV